jgi:eukaryotic-like serine/threonine-protein kinase
MDFRILGPLEVSDCGRLLELGGHKQRALLALLLLDANRVVATERLIDALWDEDPPETAQKALQVHVSQLRKLLGKERLQTKSPGYLVRVEAEELDLNRFQRLTAEGKLAEALALWRGQPLAEFPGQRFAQAEGARLKELHLACLEQRLEADLAEGRHAELVVELGRLVKQHPLRERLRSQLLLALYRSGRQAEALEAYQHARQVLVEELGIEPGRQLREMHQAILRQDPALELASPQEEAAEPPRAPFVGRELELGELLEGLDQALAGHGRLFLLVGEPGIGKSRLADELIREARSRGAEVLIGRCWEGGGAPAYWPWLQSLREYVRKADAGALRLQLGTGAVDVAQIVPEIRERIPDLPRPTIRDDNAARFELFNATASFVRKAAAQRPWVLVLDDLHAADEASLLLLRFLTGELGAANILILGTYRDVDPTVRDPLASTLSELARERVTRRIHLAGLTQSDVARYIELEAAAKPATSLAAAIHEETEGNPLFVGEVVRLLAAEGDVASADSGILSTLGIPQGVREVIGRRLKNLSEDGTRVLATASILGREFRVDVLERLAEIDAERLLAILDEAMSARLVASVPGGLGRVRFAHGLIRETLYDDLSTPRRVLLHRRAAETLERIYAGNPEPHLAELTHHFFEAAPGGDVEKARMYARQAASRLLELLAFEEAARFYQVALQTLDLEPVDPGTRCELLLGLGEAQARAGDEVAATKTFLEAAKIARSAGSPEQLARAALGYAGRFVWMPRGADEDVVPLLDDALRELGSDESALRVRVLARLAGTLRDQPEPERRTELTAQALDIARALDDRSALAYALDGRYCAVWGPDHPEERLELAEELLSVASEIGDSERRIQGHYYRAVALLELGLVHDVHDELRTMDRLVGELRQPAQRWYVEVLRVILTLLEGDFESAHRSIQTAFDFARTLRARIAKLRLPSTMLQRERGELDQAIAALQEPVEDTPTLTVFRCLLASAYAERGREAEARALLDLLAESGFDILPDNDKIFGWATLGEACSALGETTHAGRLYELLYPYADRNVVCYPACSTGSVSRYLGLLAVTLSRWEEAERHFEEALAANERMGARPWLAHTQDDYGRMLIERGQTEQAAKLIDAALVTYRELGMHGYEGKASLLQSPAGYGVLSD